MTFDAGLFDTVTFDYQRASGSEFDITVPLWFSTAINQDQGSNVNKLMKVVFKAAQTISRIHDEVYLAGFVSTATGISLDYIADGYNIKRDANETDDQFRQRIPATISIYNSCGTTADIKAAVAYLLQLASPDKVVVLERYMEYPRACFTVRLTGKPGVVVSWSEVDSLIEKIKAGGTYYESPNYNVTASWVAGAAGYGYGWSKSWGRS